MNYSIIAVEGPHDQAFIGKCLELLGFSQFDDRMSVFHTREELSSWTTLIRLPDFSKESKRDLKYYAPIYRPAFYTNQNHSIAINAVRGGAFGVFASLLQSLIDQKQIPELYSLLVVADADNKKPSDVASKVFNAFHESSIDLPKTPPGVDGANPKKAIYILPDNTSNGALEKILLECGDQVYPDLMANADTYHESTSGERKKSWGKEPAVIERNRQKSKIALAVSILQPGCTNEISIIKDDWVSKDTKEIETLKQFLDFLTTLLEN